MVFDLCHLTPSIRWRRTGAGGGGGAVTVTLNPADTGGAGIVLSNGNLTETCSANGTGVRATTTQSAGYFEVTLTSDTTAGATIGLATLAQSLAAGAWIGNAGGANGLSYYAGGGAFGPGGDAGGNLGASLATATTGDIIGIQLLASTAKAFKNGTLLYTFASIPAGALYPAISGSGGGVLTANFGATAFTFQPTGSTSWDGSRSA